MHAFAVSDIPEIGPDDDIGALVAERCEVADDDVVLVASTVVSKAEGRARSLSEFPAGPRAREIAERFETLTGEQKDPRFAQAVLEEATEVIVDEPFMLTETKFGHVGVNAGIDRSNTGGEDLLLLPERPTASAERIRDALPADAAIVVTDTSGRPFRHGQRGVALGWAGMPASRDWRGEADRGGEELEVTVESVVDELAATANLLTGEGDDGTPVVVVRDWEFGDHEGSQELFRDADSDFIRQALREWEYEG